MNSEERIEALWCVDSETGKRVLIDLRTNKIIAERNEKGEIVDAVDGRIIES